MHILNALTNSTKKAYDSIQGTLQPLREGKGPLNGTVVTHSSAIALGLSSILYATDQIGKTVPLMMTAVQLGSWFVYGNKMYTRYLPRMNQMAFASMVIGQPGADEETGKWTMNTGRISKLSETYLNKGSAAYWQFFDKGLCYEGLVPWCSEIGAKTVLDVCCGEEASYVKALNKMGLEAKGIDLNLNPALINDRSAVHGNVLEKFPKAVDRKFDLVLSIEAGAKLPKGSETTYIANLTKHAGKAIFCSWPVPGQEGPHQRNPLTNSQVTAIFNKLGWVRDTDREKALKGAADGIDFWFQNTIMAFVPGSAKAPGDRSQFE